MKTIPGNEFEMWIRRAKEDPERFDIKFRVHQGKGLLRTTFVGGAASTPASEQGERASMSADELVSSRFFMLHSGETGTPNPSRSEYRFTPNTTQPLKDVKHEAWTAVRVNTKNQLQLVAKPAVSPTPPLAPHERVKTTSRREHQPEGNSATTSIAALEKDLARSRRHIEQLKKRIDDLEAQVERLGGHVAPVILDYNA